MRGTPCALLLFATLVGCRFSPAEAEQPDANSSADASDPTDADNRARELRGVWITRFSYASATDLEAIIDRAAAAHFNAVFVQIRGESDAYYRSNVEPWARRLTGVLGRDPGWDPLQVAIDRAHHNGMELHAYFNVFTGWPANQPIPVAEGSHPHPLRAHPEWLAVDSTGTSRDGEYQWLSPAIPEVRAHVIEVARDLLTRYDVDGLHLDRIRVPGRDYSRDPITTAAFDRARAGDPNLTFGDFMRTSVSAMVAEIYALIGSVKPQVRLSAAVWGIYRPLAGCATSQGWGDYYQDSLGWLAAGSIDAIAPMMYWPIEPGACTDWSTLLDGFVTNRADRHIWAGMHALDDNSWQLGAVEARIDRARSGGAAGTVMFASAYLDGEPSRWSDLATGRFADPAVVPAMPWK